MNLDLIIDISLFLVVISIAFCAYRVIMGPTIADRVIALDTIAVNIVAVISLYAVKVGTMLFLDAGLVIAILGFVGTVAIAKFLQRGDIIDRYSD